MQEEWKKWHPISDLAEKYYIDSISDSHDALVVNLMREGSSSILTVSFDGSVACYRWSDETYMHDRTQDLFKEYGADFFCKWTLFQVLNSEYMDYISKTSGTISDHRDLQHFAFVTDESIFEVLYSYAPTVTVSNS